MKEKLSNELRRITLKQLRAYGATVASGTMSGAARMLNVTPPAINLQMRQLEDAAGMALFERTEQGMRPTAAGAELLDVSARIEACLVEFGQTLDALRGLETGQVSIGVVSTAKYFAPRALAAFTKLHPGVEWRLQVGNRGEMIGALRHYDLDFVIMGLPPPDLAADARVIADHPHIIIAPPGHPMAQFSKIALQDLTDERFLLRENTSGTRLLMQRLFDEAGLNPNLGMEIGSNETIKQAVMAGLGIALISRHTVHAELRGGRLSALDVAGLPVVRQWYLVKLQKKRLLPAARALWDFFLASSQKFLPPSGQ